MWQLQNFQNCAVAEEKRGISHLLGDCASPVEGAGGPTTPYVGLPETQKGLMQLLPPSSFHYETRSVL